MRRKAQFVVVTLALLGSVTAFGQGRGAPPPPATDTVAPNIPGVVAGGTKVQVVKDGFMGAEGPVGAPDGSLLFTETGGGRITKIDKDNRVSTFLNFAASGLGFDPKGRLIATIRTEGKTGVAVVYPKGSETTLVDLTSDPGLTFANDLVVDRKGGVYYTDPNNGRVTYITPGAETQRRLLGSNIIRVAEGITRTNGLVLSPDDKVLYVNDSRGEYMLAYDVKADGTLTNRRNFVKYDRTQPEPEGPYKMRSGADGLTVDSEGRVYNTELSGLLVYSPKGQLLGKIPVSRRAANVAFAGPDKKTLYIVGSGAVWKVQMLSQGLQGRAK
jgi:gluconolactonase